LFVPKVSRKSELENVKRRLIDSLIDSIKVCERDEVGEVVNVVRVGSRRYSKVQELKKGRWA